MVVTHNPPNFSVLKEKKKIFPLIHAACLLWVGCSFSHVIFTPGSSLMEKLFHSKIANCCGSRRWWNGRACIALKATTWSDVCRVPHFTGQSKSYASPAFNRVSMFNLPRGKAVHFCEWLHNLLQYLNCYIFQKWS